MQNVALFVLWRQVNGGKPHGKTQQKKEGEVDSGDLAQQQAWHFTEAALAAVRAQGTEKRPVSQLANVPRMCVGTPEKPCGDPIDPRRLAAVPGAIRCVQCQEAFDASLRKYYRHRR